MWTSGPVLQAGAGNEKVDPYFEHVVLQLVGRGVANSVDFIDSSLANNLVKANGDSKHTVNEYKVGTSSFQFDGTGDGLSVPHSEALAFNDADWTVELWFKTPTLPTDYRSLFIKRNTDTPFYNPLGIGLKVNGALSIAVSSDGATWQVDYTSPNSTFQTNTWHHVAVCLESKQLRVYIDGYLRYVQDGVTPMSSSHAIGIGANANGTQNFVGYMDGIRVTRGKARYSRPALPTALTSGTGMCAALNFDGSFTDLVGPTWTPSGNTAISTTYRRYGSSAVVMDGSGDRLTRDTTSGFPSADESFTISAWIRPTSMHDGGIVGWGNFGTNNQATGLAIKTTGVIQYWWGNDLSAAITTLADGSWHHVMTSYDGYQRQLYVDGVLIARDIPGVAHAATNVTTVLMGSSGPAAIDYYNGYIDDVRVYKDVALTMPTFVPPLVYVMSDKFRRSVVSLLNFNGDSAAVATDHVGRRWNVSGSPVLSTTQSRGGGSSLYLSASAYIYAGGSKDFDLGDYYTVEMWVYPTSVASNFGLIHRGYYSTGTTLWTGLSFSIRWLNTPVLRFYFYGLSIASEQYIDVPSALSANAWHHIAMVRNGSVGYAFINGVCRGKITGLNTVAVSDRPVQIGAWPYSGGTEAMTGYVDSVRITKGIARYLPPNDAAINPDTMVPADVIALPFLESHGATTTTDYAESRPWTFNGAAALSNTQFKTGTASLKLTTSSDYLTTPHATPFGLGTGDFTIEAWVHMTSWPTAWVGVYASSIIASYNGGSGTNKGWQLRLDGTASSVTGLNAYSGLTTLSWNWNTGTTFLLNTWYHIALVRKNGVVRAFLNGVQQGTPTANTEAWTPSESRPMYIGQLNDASYKYAFYGYLDSIRVTKRALYNANGNSATNLYTYDKALNKVASLLGGGNGVHAEGHLNDEKQIVWTNNATVASNSAARFGLTSINGNGSTAYLDTTDTAFNRGYGDFTWEAWVYSATTSAWSRLAETSEYNSATMGWHLSFNGTDGAGSRRLGLQLAKSGGGGARLESDAAFPNATWAHLAIVRKNNNAFMLIDGKLQTTSLDLSTENWTTGGMRLFCTKGAPSNFFSGYVNDVRFTENADRYEVNFRNACPPTAAPSANLPTVVSVLNFEGSLTDEKSHTWTAYGAAAVSTSQAKFGTYSLSVPGSSYVLGDGLSDFQFGSGDFTIEMWVRFNANNCCVFDFRGAGQDVSQNLTLFNNYGGSGNWYLYCNGAWIFQVTDPIVTVDTWYHIAISRRAGVMYFFRDGVQMWKGAFTNSLTCGTNRPVLGAQGNTIGTYMNGYIDGVRFTKGEGLYFPSRAPMTAPADEPGLTSLLNFDGTHGQTTTSDPSGLTWTFNGSSQLSSTQVRFGTTSLYLPGSSADYVSCNSVLLDLLSGGDWCVDCWMMATAAPSNSGAVWSKDASVTGMLLRLRTAMDGFEFVYPGLQQSATLGSAVRLNVWYHIAVMRVGTQHYFFMDGIGGPFSIANRTGDETGSPFSIGRSSNTGNHAPFIGYIDGLRIMRGRSLFIPAGVPAPRHFNQK